MRVVASDPRKAHRGYRPLAQQPDRRIDGMDVVADRPAAAQGDVVVPDAILQAALEVGGLRRVLVAAADAESKELADLADFTRGTPPPRRLFGSVGIW